MESIYYEACMVAADSMGGGCQLHRHRWRTGYRL